MNNLRSAYRKNQKNKLNNNEDKIKLKIRYRVENVFSELKLNNERIILRKDRCLTTFLS
jgi:hypothetical protein